MKKAALIVVSILTCLYGFSQNCIDTSYRRLYSSPNSMLVNYDAVNRSDTEILAGRYGNAYPYTAYLMKLLPSGNLLWAKTINDNSVHLYNNIIELGNKDIMSYCFNQQNSILITKTNKDGAGIWSKEIFIGDDASLVSLYRIYDYQNELYAFCSCSLSGGDFASAVIKMDTACNILWSKYYINNNNPGCAATAPIALCQINDSLLAFGRISPQYCSYIDGNTESSYYAMKIDMRTGIFGKSVAYRNPIDFGNTGEFIANGSPFVPLDNITVTNSGQYFLNGLEGFKKNNIKLRFDTSLNVFEGYEYTSNGNAFYTGVISVGTNGNSYIFYRNTLQQYAQYYYTAQFDSTNKLVRQKQLPSLSNTIASNAASKFIYKRNYINLITSITANSKSYLQLYQLDNEEQSSNCFGMDTNFISVNTYPFKIDNPRFFTTANDLPVHVVTNPDVSIDDLVIDKQETCQQISNCTSLIIKQQLDTACTPIKTFIVYKNGQCYKHIYWQIDSAAVDSLVQLTDTTISIYLKKTWQDTIWLYASVNSCLDFKDSIRIYQNITARENVTLGNDTTLCMGGQLYLNAASGFKTYLWQDGSSDSFFLVKQAGKYLITATDYCDNRFYDTITVSIDSPSVYLGKDTSICTNTTLMLIPTQNFSKYLWSTGSISNSIAINQPGTYWVQVMDNNLCYGSDTIQVTAKNCNDYFFMPNSFTPNNDGINDKIKPLITGDIEAYEFRIYNRYGQLIFETGNVQDNWDGSFKSKRQNSGAFVWYCSYKRRNEIEKIEKGIFLLIR